MPRKRVNIDSADHMCDAFSAIFQGRRPTISHVAPAGKPLPIGECRPMTAPDHKRSLTIITTHMNADFDAMASMLAAQKLYPEALVVFPGSQEKNLRNFFINSMVYLFNMADIGDIDFSDVKRLVLVDTRQPNRIGKFTELLGNDEVEIHVYDHHPLMENDVRGEVEHCRLTGATVTILSELIRRPASLQAKFGAEQPTIP